MNITACLRQFFGMADNIRELERDMSAAETAFVFPKKLNKLTRRCYSKARQRFINFPRPISEVTAF